jgi:hypothetical protein
LTYQSDFWKIKKLEYYYTMASEPYNLRWGIMATGWIAKGRRILHFDHLA